MLARLFLRKGAIVPEHSHENEQITYILEGALRFTMGDGRVLTVRRGPGPGDPLPYAASCRGGGGHPRSRRVYSAPRGLDRGHRCLSEEIARRKSVQRCVFRRHRQFALVAAIRLRGVQSDVHLAQYILAWRVAPLPRGQNANADGEGYGSAGGWYGRSFDAAAQLIGAGHRLLCGATAQDHQELFSSQATDQIIGADGAKESPGRLAQDLVADGVAEAVVDALEVIEIREQHRGGVRSHGWCGQFRGPAYPGSPRG